MNASGPALIAGDTGLRREWMVALIVAAILATTYGVTLQPGVGGTGDAAKFGFLGWVLGTPHVTGFPGYLMLNYAVTHMLPFGSVAVRANLLSAVLAAIACAVVFAVLRLLDRWRSTAMTAALGLGVSATLWSYATIAEVYTLHLLSCALIVLFLLRWERSRRPVDLYLTLAVLAAALGNHVTVVCWLPAVVLFIVLVEPRVLIRPRFLACVVGIGVLGLLQYSYLVWRTFDPGTPFLEAKASDLPELVDVVLGGRYRKDLWLQSAGEIVTVRVPWIAGALLRELAIFLPFVLIGLLRPLTRRDALLIGAGVTNLAFVALYTNSELIAYLIPVVFIAMLYAADGLQRAFERLPRIRGLAWLMLLMPLALCVVNWRGADRSGATDPEQTRSIVASAPDPSLIVIPSYDLGMQITYSVLVEGGGSRQVLLVAPQVFDAPFGFDELLRYLCDGTPFRLPPRGRLIPPDLPIVLAGTTAHQRELLRNKGFQLQAEGQHLIRMTDPDCGRPRLPLAVVVHEIEPQSHLLGAVEALTDPAFDARSRAVVIDHRAARYPLPPDSAKVWSTEWADHRAEFMVESTEPGWLVVFDSFPSFWRAWVDGQPAPSLDANVIHRGVPIPSGRHRVQLRDASRRFSMWRWLTGAHPPLQP